MLTTLEKCKLKLGISHSFKDAVIEQDIEAARMELIRIGCEEDVVRAGDNPLIERAVETFILMEYSDPSLREKYEAAWELQVNNLRKSEGYRAEAYGCV